MYLHRTALSVVGCYGIYASSVVVISRRPDEALGTDGNTRRRLAIHPSHYPGVKHRQGHGQVLVGTVVRKGK